MRFNQVTNISQLRNYFNTSNTTLTLSKYGEFEIIKSYYTPIGYIYNNELFILSDRTFSTTTGKYLYTLKSIANYFINTRELTIMCKQMGISTGWL